LVRGGGKPLAAVLFLVALAVGVPAWSGSSPLDHARKILDEAWRGTPFQIERTVLVTGAADGYGVIDRRADNVFRMNEKIYLYVEPVGYDYRTVGDLHLFGFDADFLVRRADGEILGGQRSFARFGFESMHKNREIYVDIEYEFFSLPPGEYVVETTLHDRVGGAQATTETVFTVEGNLFQRQLREERL